MRRWNCLLLGAAVSLAACSSSVPTPTYTIITVSLPNRASALALLVGGTAAVTVSENGYGGTFTASSANSSIATVSPNSASGAFTVAAIKGGNTSIGFTDSNGNATSVSVTVSSSAPTPAPGTITLTPSALSFTAAGASYAQTVAAAEPNYTGSFTAATAAAGQANSCSGIATISPSSGTMFTVTPVAAGSCAFTISGGNGQTATLGIGVTTTTVGGS